MSEPFDPYRESMRPVDYPQAGPQPPYPNPQSPYPGPQSYQSPQSPYPGQMRNIDQFTTALVRPRVVVVSFVFWVLAALSWPVGTVVRTLAEDDGSFAGFGPIMTLFATGCIGVAGVWGAVLLIGGSYQARIGLVGVSLVIGVLALAAVIVAARDGDAGPLSWVVMVLRLALPAVATVFAFLPGTRHYFAGNMG
ncbi:hypothetical protein ALI22I_41125 [Saccharothrix sp. ALI-22-I]|uniref:hypothetical protein n=1 Tax=Saccharothrix sp. ALI-22-I TaxID=1933778 RepID=UPI00097C090B|nr:hypothetical protein [Saccharothrix sp. ALI-22-I]ONI82475.1 hypothetical protein ALI22I_41125 [Saccharothrix sp. ALI-22-I]